MKIAVCVDANFIAQNKKVANIKQAIEEPNNEELDMAIETSSIAALQLAKSLATEKDSITAISYGGTSNRTALQYALAFGVTSVVHLTGEKEIAKPSNPQGVAHALATYINEQSFDLIICGNPSGTGLVPSLIAGQLQIPCLPRAYEINKRAEGELELYQRLERGWRQRTTAKLPAVITVQDGFFPVQYVSVTRIRRALQNFDQVLEVRTVDHKEEGKLDLQSVSAPRTRAKRTAVPDAGASASDRLQALMGGGIGPGGGGGFGAAAQPAQEEEEQGVIETTPDKAAEEIISFLEEKELLPDKISTE